MTGVQTDVVASAVVTHRLVAAFDLLTTSERDADGLAHRIAHALAAGGVDDVTAATHWAQVEEFRHVAISVDVEAADAHILEAVLSDLLPDDDDGSGSSGSLLDGRFIGDRTLADALTATVEAHRTRSSGRVVVFRGGTRLIGTVSVRAVLADSAIDRVQVLAAGDAESDQMLVTRDFLRPRWCDGELVLHVQPALGGTFVPFETPNPTPCCAIHP